jgi:hypothetical protein
MANGQENLIPLSKRSKEVQRDIQEKGRQANREKRAKAKTFKALLNVMLEEIDPKTGKTYRELMNESMLEQAIKKGNVKAYEVLRDTSGEIVKAAASVDLNTDNPLKALSSEDLKALIKKNLK